MCFWQINITIYASSAILAPFKLAAVAPFLDYAFEHIADNSQGGAKTLFTKTTETSLFIKALEYIPNN